MMTGSICRRLLRFAGVLALAGFTVGCASPHGGATVAPPGFGKDPASRAERLVQYCDRLAEKGEMVTALGLCARANEINPDDPVPLMKMASILTSMNHPDAAAGIYNALLERHPSHHEARYSLGKVYMDTGNTSLAEMHFHHAMRSEPKDPRPYNALGILQDQAGEHAAAQALYRTALAHDPSNFSVRNNLGLSLVLNGQRDEAIEVLAELAVDPQAGETVLRNLEAAYASRALPDPSGALSNPTEVPSAVPFEPVNTESLDEPNGSAMPMKSPAAKAGPESGVPPAGAPTPLFVPQAGSDPHQEGAQRSEPEQAARSSVILAAAERLMQPPERAVFEPGSLNPAESPQESESNEEFGVDRMDSGPGDYSLTMLLLDSSSGIA